MDESKYKELFKKIIRKKHGMNIDFNTIEKKLQHLRDGEALTYSDLENIADDDCWPFNKYWMWPCKEQIAEKLKSTAGWFKNLPENEEKIIGNLCEIFRNISLVSIILRFVWPKHYVIYSRPPLKILRIERGPNDLEEYLNYVQEMRLLRHCFGVTNTSEVDMIVWAIAQEKGEYLREFKELLAEYLPENLTPAELITFLSNNPLKIAETYYKQKDYKTAGFWAARTLEKHLRDNCMVLLGFLPQRENGEIQTLIHNLCKTKEYQFKRETLHKLRRLRNKAIHESRYFTKDDAKNSIELLKGLCRE